MRYKPWGEVRSWWTAGLSTTPAYQLPNYTFTGQYSDSYINLLWYGSRHYDPALGRFTSPDTIIPGANNPQDWDRYSYTFNNPVRYVDPDGHFPIPLIALLVISAVALTASDPLPDSPARVQPTIYDIKASSPTDADALVTMFTSDKIPGNTPVERLNVILDATSNGPFTHFAIPFGDSGFKNELRDPWPDDSGNQVGHFLTAVDIGYNLDNPVGLSAIVGHEMYSDDPAWSIPAQLRLGLTNPSARDLFTTGTDDAFQQILNSGSGPLENRTGNSMEDLRLSYLGWTMGRLYRQGFFTSHASVGRWLQEHIAE
jgi:RHS repeat-associated protein